jgi:hypothetical protein
MACIHDLPGAGKCEVAAEIHDVARPGATPELFQYAVDEKARTERKAGQQEQGRARRQEKTRRRNDERHEERDQDDEAGQAERILPRIPDRLQHIDIRGGEALTRHIKQSAEGEIELRKQNEGHADERGQRKQREHRPTPDKAHFSLVLGHAASGLRLAI